jgi:hypothetical protein
LAPTVAAADERIEATLDHRHDRFNLDAIAVGSVVKAGLHEPPIMTAGWFGGGPAVLGRHDRADATFLARKRVISLRIITGVGDDAIDSHAR